jgi:endonuclease I
LDISFNTNSSKGNSFGIFAHRFKRHITYLLSLLIVFLLTSDVYSQAGTYYNSVSTSSPAFVDDLKGRIRTPYNRIAYDNFDETIIANFTAFNNGNGTHSVFCVYSGYEHIYPGVFSWGTMSREHTWAHSWMPTYPSTQNDQYSDQNMLFPTHQNNANGRRSNHPFGKVVNITYQFLDGKLGTDSAGNIVYEPMDSFKGDVARALLYAAVRYDGVSGNSWSFNWLNNTKLPSLAEGPQSIELLVQWHRNDPPDRWEIERNDYIQSIQLNRNPFADRPEYASYIDFNNMIKISPTYAAEPTNYVTSLSSSASAGTVTLNWNDAVGTQLPEGYLITAFNKDNYIVPMDGVSYTSDTVLTDGKAYVLVPYSSANNYTFTGLQTNTRYYFTVYSYNGSGGLTNYKIDGTAPQTNILVNPSLASEPTNHAGGLSVTNVSSSSVQINWNDALPGTQAPSGYLLTANNSNNFSLPSDGLQYSDDPVLSDGYATVNLLYSGANTYTFTGLLAGTNYFFRLYSYNGTGTQVNYKTDGTIPQTSGTTSSMQSANVTVLTDNFTRGNSNFLGSTLLAGNIFWQETETVTPGSISLSNSRMKLASTTSGREFAFVNLSQLVGYEEQFSSADTTLVWAFNMRQTRLDPSGQDNNNYGVAYIIGKTTSDLASGNGYAVVLGQSGSTDAIRLAKFTGGVVGNTRFTNIISGGDYANQYLSIKVTYQPGTNTWSLYTDSSSVAFPQSDPRNSIVQIGSAVDNSYTSDVMPYSGALWNHVSGVNDSAVFDDIYVSDLSLRLNNSVIPEGFLNDFTGTLNMPDTVRVYLRNSTAPYQIIDSAKSVIDSISFTGYFEFELTISGSYYISVVHRNSIETWSNLPVAFSHGSIMSYDFTSAQGNAYANNTVLKNGKYCLYTGDINQDGTVDGLDLSVIDNDAFTFQSGYVISDLNGDGIADASDASLADNNAFNFVSRIIP